VTPLDALRLPVWAPNPTPQVRVAHSTWSALSTSSTVRWERTRTKPVAEVPKLMAAAVALLPDQSDGVKTYHHRSETTHNNHKKLIRIASSTEHASSKSSQNTKK
jgi:hypothetical protein